MGASPLYIYIFKLDNWNPTITLEYLITNLGSQLEMYIKDNIIQNLLIDEFNTYDYSKCIGDNLKDSEDFIEAALDINPNFIYLASHKIRHNKKILEKVIQLNKNYHIYLFQILFNILNI